jgi:hypothetical protein
MAKVDADGRYDGTMGHCARFAVALNHAPGDALGISEVPGPAT